MERTEEPIGPWAGARQSLQDWLREQEVKAGYRKAHRRFRRLVRNPRILSLEERDTLLRALEKKGAIDIEETAEVEEADLGVQGQPLGGEGEAYLVVGIAVPIRPEDVERAAALRKALPEAEVRAVVAGPEIHPDAARTIRGRGVWWLRGNRPFAPEEIPVAPPSR